MPLHLWHKYLSLRLRAHRCTFSAHPALSVVTDSWHEAFSDVAGFCSFNQMTKQLWPNDHFNASTLLNHNKTRLVNPSFYHRLAHASVQTLSQPNCHSSGLPISFTRTIRTPYPHLHRWFKNYFWGWLWNVHPTIRERPLSKTSTLLFLQQNSMALFLLFTGSSPPRVEPSL